MSVCVRMPPSVMSMTELPMCCVDVQYSTRVQALQPKLFHGGALCTALLEDVGVNVTTALQSAVTVLDVGGSFPPPPPFPTHPHPPPPISHPPTHPHRSPTTTFPTHAPICRFARVSAPPPSPPLCSVVGPRVARATVHGACADSGRPDADTSSSGFRNQGPVP